MVFTCKCNKYCPFDLYVNDLYKMASQSNDANVWPPRVEKLFVDIMEQENVKGNIVKGVFKPSTWTTMQCTR